MASIELSNHFSRLKYVLFLCLFTLISPLKMQASQLSPVRLFSRCYSDLTNLPIPLSDSRVDQVKSGSLDPITACIDLLNATQINPNDPEGKITALGDSEKLGVFQNIYNIATNYTGRSYAYDNLDALSNETTDFYDFTSVGLAITEAIFNPNRQFREIFTATRIPVAKRQLDSGIPYPYKNGSTNILPALSRASDLQIAMNSWKLGHTYSTNNGQTYIKEVFNTKLIEVGELVGINYASPIQNIRSTEMGLYSHQPSPIYDMNANLIPGVVGHRTYVIANTNFIDGRSDLHYMPRRLTRAIAQDFLCRDLPVLRESDITNLISNVNGANSFRKAGSCTNCHAFMDQMASVYRGISLGSARPQDQGAGVRESTHVFLSNATLASESTVWPAVPDPEFWKRPAKGKLFFRSLTNPSGPISVDLNSAADLGSALANTDDVYICFAKKMFQHFTGIDVRLIDIYDPANSSTLAAMTNADFAFREYVINLGVNFKTHQSAKKVIEEILKSNYYKNSDYLTGGP